MLVKLSEAEADRLHVPVDPWGMDVFDFYGEMARVIKNKVGDSIPIVWKGNDIDMFYSAVYLSCLLLLGKPGYLDIPVAQYFAQDKAAAFMKAVGYRKLAADELGRLEGLRKNYGHIQALTNPELNFIVSLYERERT
jgi:hypothetical protein